MNKVIRGGAREIIYKVFMRCMAAYQAGKLLSDLDDVYKRTAEFTDVSLSTVRRIVQQGMEKGGKLSTPAKHRKGRPLKVLDDFDICAIRQKIHFFYTVKKEAPTIGKLLIQLTEDIGYEGSREYLRRLLRRIGFRYKKCSSGRQALLEKPIIAYKREQYLKKIMDNRNLAEELQKDILYLYESYIHSSCKLKKCWQSLDTKGVTIDKSKGTRWIIVHIKLLTLDAFISITSNDWKNCCQHVKKIEKEYYDRGRTLYNDIDELVRVDTDTTDCDTDSDESLLEMYTSKENLGASTSQEPSTMEGVEFLDFELLD